MGRRKKFAQQHTAEAATAQTTLAVEAKPEPVAVHRMVESPVVEQRRDVQPVKRQDGIALHYGLFSI